jgi:hypothetical protein
MEIVLGWKVKDKVTGLIGIAVAKCTYLNGCIQYNVVPPVNKENSTPKNIWIDEGQLSKVSDGIIEKPKDEILLKKRRLVVKSTGGGERSHPND